MTDSRSKSLRDLSPEQRDLLRRRLARLERQASDRAPELKPHPRGDSVEVPLSFAQESAWFLDRLSPGDPGHNLTGALRLEGTLSTRALSATFDELVRRHETLRANFHAASRGAATAGKPAQVIGAPCPLPIRLVDLSGLAPDLRRAERRRLFTAETRRGFDLVRDRLLRATLIRVGRAEHLLLLTVHHIAADGWSLGLLVAEIAELYSAYAQSLEPKLAPAPIQYGDFAMWQRQRMQGDTLERELAYWRQSLADLPPPLELPSDRTGLGSVPPAEHELDGATCSLRIERPLKQGLDRLSRNEDATLFATLLCAFMVLLMRCTGRQDIVVGSPVSGRIRVETERVVGVFLNTLALRAKLSLELTFRRALGVVRRAVLKGLEHHEVPLERVVRHLDPDRGSTGQPLFATIFNFTPSPPRQLELATVRARFEEPPEMRAKFSMELFVAEQEGTLELKLLYPKERYSEARMAIFLEQLQAVLQQVVREPDRRVGSLDLSTPASQALLPDPAVPLDEPAQQPVPHAIADWAARVPDQPAICQGGTTLTYGQLGVRMTAVAESLWARGLEPGGVVAVLGPRSPGVVVSMAGTLRAGGVLLTLSPDLPEKRHRLMLENAGARFLLQVGDPRGEDGWLHEDQGLEIVAVDAGGVPSGPRVGGARDQDPEELAPSRYDPAYIFFTSGSTGRPKAVLGSHAGLAHFLAWQRRTFEVGPGDRCAQLTGLSFDVVLRDIFLALTAGASLIVPEEDDLASGDRTLSWLEREEITLLHTVPSVIEMWLLKRPPEASLTDLRIFSAGEPLTGALVERWRAAFPRAGEIVNLYGPTETTLAKCCYRVPARPRAGIQPLGCALPQAQALVLTPQRGLCGVGEPGEIAIRTPFRSLGFLGAPEETEKRFIVNPFRDDLDDRLYLTGDHGAYGADGLLGFLGRLDHQVKVRGVRIEPTEVAVTLQSCPEVAACAVMVRDDIPDGPGLVAYVVTAAGAGKQVSRLRDFLRRRLPAAMLPASFVFIDELPLTSNQKLDCDRLPAPSGERPALEIRYIAPRDVEELQLAQIWEELLDVRPVGVTDSFFEIGGHSLMALRMLVEVERRVGKKVPLAALFKEPTIEHLAAVVRQGLKETPLLVTLRAGDHRCKLFLVHPGGGTLMNYVYLTRYLTPEIPIHGIQARGLDGKREPHETLEQMAADYIEEIRRLQAAGPYLLAGHSLGGVIAFEMARQLLRQGEGVAFLGLFDSVAPVAPVGEDHAPADARHEDALRLAGMAKTIERFLGTGIGVSYDDLCELSDDEQIEAVVAALKRTRALPPGDEHTLVRNLLDVSKAHIRAHRAYRAEAVPVAITLFRARDAQRSDYPSASAEVLRRDSLGWGTLTTEPVRILQTSGNHVTMMSEPHAEDLARTLSPLLVAALELDDSNSPSPLGEARV